ncbi:dTDP-4-dehydrorhamnose 3,5-epimerase [Motilibacter peucedani]|uniref:dTDP-4-dehydrorhamnose 3,5-epimerase n=1 Tax=Motilibacter peucedani TaxID=598650 RepID=A0A420XKL1_9ACTN|nr:dTDP-4-dehydrorhamnose 3,5-epimerase [Motilibacter peucedani]RKS68619.1 dTDP-4-dehydrorhamnose 3,5-epimerase [Motilibacter peucedani]
MEIRRLSVPDAYEVTPVQHRDGRGAFLEWFREDVFEAEVGRPFRLRQANVSVSRLGALRGVHFADVPPGQAKYVTCLSGSVLDVVVDLRVGSPTFGRWDAVELDDVSRRAVFLSEGLGHGFVARTDGAVVSYLCSEGYAPGREHGVMPFDPDLGVDWGAPAERLLLSPKDEAAPTLAQARADGLLPDYRACRALYAASAS